MSSNASYFSFIYEGHLSSPGTFPFILLFVIFMYKGTHNLPLNENVNML